MPDHGVEAGQVWATPALNGTTLLVLEVDGDEATTLDSHGEVATGSASLIRLWWVEIKAPEGATA